MKHLPDWKEGDELASAALLKAVNRARWANYVDAGGHSIFDKNGDQHLNLSECWDILHRANVTYDEARGHHEFLQFEDLDKVRRQLSARHPDWHMAK